jgi:Lrp/AsnC family transcriptional regulator for asnA, asnC and gidA
MAQDTPLKLDEMDLLLMRELESDGRLSIADLARKAGTSRTTVRKRLETLIDNGIIAIVGWVNPYALGYRTSAMIGIDVQHNKIDDIAKSLKAYPFVQSVIVTTGQFDMMIWAFFYDQQHLVGFLKNELGNTPGVNNAETMIILDVQKAFTRLL